VPRKHHFPPSFPACRSTAQQRLQSILLVYRRSGEYRWLHLAGLSGCQSNLEPEPPVWIPRAFAGESPRESRVPLEDLSFSFSRLDSLNFGLKPSHVLLLRRRSILSYPGKPVSEKQLEANRGNAPHSTGPRSRAGKGRPSCMNSQTDPFGKPNPNQKHHLRPATDGPWWPGWSRLPIGRHSHGVFGSGGAVRRKDGHVS
jgi:hypothetical protein